MLGLWLLYPVFAVLPPDNDNIPQLKVQAADTAIVSQQYTITIGMDEDAKGVRGLQFDITFNPPLCGSNSTSVQFLQGTFGTKQSNVLQSGAVRVIEANLNNAVTNDGPLDLASVTCTVNPLANGTPVTLGLDGVELDNMTGGAIPNAAGVGKQITVSTGGPVNHAPVADSQSVTTTLNTVKTITLTASDADGDSLTFTQVAVPSHGLLGAVTQLTPTSAQVTYTPTTGFTGPDSFTFKANDGKVDSNTATVSITVAAPGAIATASSTPSSTPSHTPFSSNSA